MSMGFLNKYRLSRIGVLLALGACSGPAPYVFNASEFNRKSSTYAKDAEDIANVTVCYAKGNTTPKEVRKLAKDECSKFKKEVRLLKQDYSTCPMTAPVSAHFECYIPQPAGSVGIEGDNKQREFGNYGRKGLAGPGYYQNPLTPGEAPIVPSR